jgi:hypothetical protein
MSFESGELNTLEPAGAGPRIVRLITMALEKQILPEMV